MSALPDLIGYKDRLDDTEFWRQMFNSRDRRALVRAQAWLSDQLVELRLQRRAKRGVLPEPEFRSFVVRQTTYERLVRMRLEGVRHCLSRLANPEPMLRRRNRVLSEAMRRLASAVQDYLDDENADDDVLEAALLKITIPGPDGKAVTLASALDFQTGFYVNEEATGE